MQLFDVHSRFAQVHLRTPAERAVYFTLVAQFAESWSAVEIAQLKDVDVETVEAVLDRYADAGVVDVVDSAIGLRYRWCSDLSYLSRPGSRGARIDPVCGSSVIPEERFLAIARPARWLLAADRPRPKR